MSENKDFTYSITDSSKTITGIVDYKMIQRLNVENTKYKTRAVDLVHKTYNSVSSTFKSLTPSKKLNMY
jgi:hypothetical protein